MYQHCSGMWLIGLSLGIVVPLVTAQDQQRDERPSYSVDVSSPGAEIAPGVPVVLISQLKDPSGETIVDLERVHEKLLHVIIVADDLSWYAHEYPKQRRDGAFELRTIFPNPGRYVLFHNFMPEGGDVQVVAAEVVVPGEPPERQPLDVDATAPKDVGGYTVQLQFQDRPAAGREASLAFTVTRDGEPVRNLEPYLGARGHLVIISEDLQNFVHGYPLEEGPVEEEDDCDHGGGLSHESVHAAVGSIGAQVAFTAEFPATGLYRAWVQFRHRGRVLTVPFAFDVKGGNGRTARPSERATGKERIPRSEHGHHH